MWEGQYSERKGVTVTTQTRITNYKRVDRGEDWLLHVNAVPMD